MNKYVLAVSICTGLLTCSSAFSQLMLRPTLMSEQLYAIRSNELPRADTSWSRSLLELDIPGYIPHDDDSYSQACNFNNALATLRKIRLQLGQTAAYQKMWAKNQDAVFSACDKRAAAPIQLVEPKGKGLPKRARSDYLYQLASWYFYQGKFDDALSQYTIVKKMRVAPQRANAAYMVARTLAHLKRFDEAYATIGRILADRSLLDVHAITGNYRFVIMSNSNYLSGYKDAPLSPELASTHLRWLVGLVRVDPEKAADPQQSATDYKDAMEQLATYFPLYDQETRSIDWWLGVSEANFHESRSTPRMMKETWGWRCRGRSRENSLGADTPIANLTHPHRLVPRIDSIGFADEISR